ncbi:MAG: alpha amylase C-terminal domain-containing protein [Methylacidiphilales bacterium]|nr:alpha amylase C-terminal domain-containing protein [Candidatus Methylacidiphilales bacterium]
MTVFIHNPRRLGALADREGVSFRVWAPNASSVSVVGEFNGWKAESDPMERQDGGYWFRRISGARTGQQYQFEIANGERRFRKNDAYARVIDSKSAISVIYEDKFKWNSPDYVLPNWNELLIYELHVGTFAAGPYNSPGRFEQIVARLSYLKNLGVNAIEIMPPMAFPGERSWGYNLTNPFAVDGVYGGPDGLKRLIDAAHAQGIGVILDIVYNHFGPDDLDLWQYDGWSENNRGGIYFYNDQRAWTPWGENRPDYGRGEVRQYIRDNALLWLEEFHVDGIRVDATAFIRNTTGTNGGPQTDLPDGWSLLQWVNDEIAHHFPGRIRIAEDLLQNPWLTKPTKEGGAGFDTQWDSAFVHPVRQSVTCIEDGQRSMASISHALEFRYNEDFIQRVIYSESHDEVANGKARVPQEISPEDTAGYYARKRSTLAAGLVLTTPGIPMLFEGQEFLENGWFRDDRMVDWKKLETFKGINRLYRELIHLRRNHFGNTRGLTGPFIHVHHLNDHEKVIAFHRWAEGGAKDDVIVAASFSHQPLTENYRIGFPHGGRWIIRFNSDWKGYSSDFNDVGNPEGHVRAEKQPYDGFDYSGTVALPPYGFLIFSQEENEAEEAPAPNQEASA